MQNKPVEEKKWHENPVVDQLMKINFNTYKIRRLLEERQGGVVKGKDEFDEMLG